MILKTQARKNLIDFAQVLDRGYQANWHHKLIANKLQEAYHKVLRGERVRIIIEVPPRHGKSDISTIKFPAWVLGKNPELPVIVVAYAQDLANDFGLATKDLVNTNNYKLVFNKTRLRADSRAKAKWNTEQKGGYTAVGVGGPITGRGFKLGIIDDPIKNRAEADSEVVRESIWKWYKSTFLTREDGNGAVIVIMTRWHDDDLVGRILQGEDASEWERIRFPAIAEEDEKFRKKGDALWEARFPLEVLNNRKRDLGPYEWSALYQQNPVDEEAQEFKQSWIKTRTMKEAEKLYSRCFVTIDPADALTDKSDYIGMVINHVDKENKWNLEAYRVKVNSMDLISLMFKIYKDTRFEKIGIEEGAYNNAIKPFLDEEMRKRNTFFTVVALKHQQQNKLLRIRGLIPRYASGSIFHLEGLCSDLEEELVRFPRGVHDDVLDSLAYQLQISESPLSAEAMKQTKPALPYYSDRDVAF